MTDNWKRSTSNKPLAGHPNIPGWYPILLKVLNDLGIKDRGPIPLSEDYDSEEPKELSLKINLKQRKPDDDPEGDNL